MKFKVRSRLKKAMQQLRRKTSQKPELRSVCTEVLFFLVATSASYTLMLSHSLHHKKYLGVPVAF